MPITWNASQVWQDKLGVQNGEISKQHSEANGMDEWRFGSDIGFRFFAEEAEPSLQRPTEEQAKALMSRYLIHSQEPSPCDLADIQLAALPIL